MERFDFSKKLFFHPERILKIKNGERPFPLTVEIDLTDVCNHRCVFCFTPKDDKDGKRTLKTDRVLKLLDELWEMGTRGISFTGGGESMLHKDFKLIADRAKDIGFDLGLMTNGSMLIDVDLINRDFQWVRISMSGGNSEIYNKVQGVNHFELVVKNIKNLCSKKKKDLVVGIRMLVNETNIKSVKDMINTFEDSGITYIQFAADQFAKKDITMGYKFKKILRDISTKLKIHTQGYEIEQDKAFPQKCYAHYFQGVVNAKGEILFCKNCRNSNKYRIGNIYDNSLQEIWEGEIVKNLEASITPYNCGLFCKNSKLNNTMQEILYPDNSIQPNFVN